MPEVDHIVGVFGREEIAQVVGLALARHRLPRGEGEVEQRSLFRPAPVKRSRTPNGCASRRVIMRT